MSKIVGNCIAGALCVIALGAIVAPKIPSMIAAAMEERAVATDGAADPQAVDEIVHYLRPDLELETSRMSASEYPPMETLLDEDIPETVLEFDLASGVVSNGYSLIEAARLVKGNSDENELQIARDLYDGGVRKNDTKGYVFPRFFPSYFHANYPPVSSSRRDQ